jgi:DNA repair protein RadA/Sms
MAVTRKTSTVFACQACGYQSTKWMGKCPGCAAWNTIAEERLARETTAPGGRAAWLSSKPRRISEIEETPTEARQLTQIGEFDRVMGGGVVAGSVTLIGGDPGIGKSTLLLAVLQRIAEKAGTVLYVSGEESQAQIRMRAERMGVGAKELFVQSETSFEEIVESAKQLKPKAIVIDSIQTMYTVQLTSAPGSVGQIRETAASLMGFAKQTATPVLLVGHVTKDGAIAGPRVLEHIVDTVLYFEGDKGHPYRILRAVKNRFGSTNEIGVFEMHEDGLAEVTNPSAFFLAERPMDAAGSVVVASLEGSRPILIELQALVTPSHVGMARRMVVGVDANRVSLLLAVLEKRAGLFVSGHDIFVNVVGGIELEEPAIDLGIAAAITSSFREKPIDSGTVLFGEVGLAGEIRAIQRPEVRVAEAAKMGFHRCLLPESNAKRMSASGGGSTAVRASGVGGIELVPVRHLREVIERLA